MWGNMVDDPAHCSVSLPAVVRRGPVTVSVATDGASPTLAVVLRDRVAEQILTPEVADLARTAGDVRRDLQSAGQPTTAVDWRALFASALDG